MARADLDPGERHFLRMLGEALQRDRRRKGMTQTALAKRAALHPVHLSRIERGVASKVGVLTVWKLANGLERTLTSLLKETERSLEGVYGEDGYQFQITHESFS